MVGQKLVGLLNTRIKAFKVNVNRFRSFAVSQHVLSFAMFAVFVVFAVFATLYRVLRKRFILSLAHFYVSSQYISKEGV